jgi:hypothetical protein
VLYSKPIFTAANAVDQSQQAKMAKNVVLLRIFFIIVSINAKVKKL